MMGHLVRLSESPPSPIKPAPMLGEHTDEIMKELGYKDEDVKALREKGVIR